MSELRPIGYKMIDDEFNILDEPIPFYTMESIYSKGIGTVLVDKNEIIKSLQKDNARMIEGFKKVLILTEILKA